MMEVTFGRDLQLESRERERFKVLCHVVSTSEGDVGAVLLCSRVADDLGLARWRAAELLDDLIHAGYLADAGAGPSISVTPAGVLYVHRRAGRRHSVRATLNQSLAPNGLRAALQRILGGPQPDAAQRAS